MKLAHLEDIFVGRFKHANVGIHEREIGLLIRERDDSLNGKPLTLSFHLTFMN